MIVVDSIVGGSLSLEHNELIELPSSFGSISVGLSLDLRGNELEALPGATVAPLYLLHCCTPALVYCCTVVSLQRLPFLHILIFLEFLQVQS